MDSNIKKELIDGINQLSIKKEETVDSKSTMDYQASSFVSVIDVDSAVTINVDQSRIKIVNGPDIHRFYHGSRLYKAENIPKSRTKVVLNGLRQQGFDVNGQPTTVAINLTLIFDDAVQFGFFFSQLVRELNYQQEAPQH